MKILLVNSATRPHGTPDIFPIHLAMLGGILMDHGHKVWALDFNDLDYTQKKLKKILATGPFDIIGISYRNILGLHGISGHKPLEKMVRLFRPHGHKLVVGGAAFSIFAEEIFPLFPQIDFGVVGEGELPLLRLAQGINPKNIPQLCYIKDGKLIINKRDDSLPGDKIPLLRDINGLRWRGLVGIHTNRGCRKSCSFCPGRYIQGSSSRQRSLEDIKKDLDFLVEKGARHIYFLNSKINIPLSHCCELLDKLIEWNLPFTWEASLLPDSRINRKFIKKLENSGCAKLHIDILTFSKRWNRILYGDLNPQVKHHTISLINKSHIDVIFYFLYGIPGQKISEELITIMRILSLLAKNLPPKKAFLHPYFAFPHTKLGDRIMKGRKMSTISFFLEKVRKTLRPSTPLFFFLLFHYILRYSADDHGSFSVN